MIITREPLQLIRKIKSPKIQPLLKLMENRENNNSHSHQEQFSRISNFALINNIPEIIDELIALEIDLEQKIDPLRRETMLAVVVQYPYYHELFVKLIEAGAKTYCTQNAGDPDFYSNTLYRSVKYDEFLNITYLVNKEICSMQNSLEACYNQNKLHMLQYFLETCKQEDLNNFKNYVLNTPMLRQQEVNKLISQIVFASI